MCKSTSATGHNMIDDTRYPDAYRANSGQMRRHTVCTGCGNVGNREAESVDIIVTRCDTHGIKATVDYTTARICVEAATYCMMESLTEMVTNTSHADEHDDGIDCWVCCNQMVIDPYGIFDH